MFLINSFTHIFMHNLYHDYKLLHYYYIKLAIYIHYLKHCLHMEANSSQVAFSRSA